MAVGLPAAGSLVRGVRFPGEGNPFFTWDPIHREQPNRTLAAVGHRRHRTHDTRRAPTLRAREHPQAPRVGVDDGSGRPLRGRGATTVYVGPNLPLTGPPEVVIPLADHDNHLHARFAPK